MRHTLQLLTPIVGFSLALFSAHGYTAEPASGNVSAESPSTEFDSGPHTISNPSYPDAGTCQEPTFPCDDYALTVQVPGSGEQAILTVSTVVPDADDYDIYLLDSDGNEITSSASGDAVEVMTLPINTSGDHNYTVRIIPFLATATTATTKIELTFVAGSGGSAGGGDGSGTGGIDRGELPFDPTAPRYSIYVSPANEGNDAGEPTVGYNPLTERAMFISYVNALRVTFPENLDEPLPQACDALWENKSGLITTLNSLDPIMYTDKTTGRTFNSQLAGANSLFEFSDDDGESWTPGQIGLPNGGADHQGVVSGPYPDALPIGGILFPNAVYYCSQSVASAFCARSDDGGQTFGPGMPFKNTDCSAGGLHGHPKVAPDGTLYIPDSSQCVLTTGVDGSADKIVAFVSEDAGATYDVRPLPDSQGGAGSDPSIGIATDGTAYMCYENADGTSRVAVSHDKGLTWENDQDIGLAAGLVATRFQAAVAGDPDRAACAFLGTSSVGPDLELSFEGVWYPYIATTYDGGETWQLVNLSPGNPVQGFGGVGTSGTNRNLLDFNDLELDNLGRPLFAYADGCVGGCERDPAANGFAAKATLARQSGGLTLLAEFDNLANSQLTTAQLAPAAACALQDKSSRTVNQTVVAWRAPDNGGTPISNYQVYRATQAQGPFEFIGDAGSKTTFVDTSSDVSVAEYSYRVVAQNAVGDAGQSNVVTLPIQTQTEVDTCHLPGEIILLDSAGDSAGVDDYDIISAAVAEPAEFPGSLAITLKLANFTTGAPPATSFYPILFPLLNNRYIAFDASSAPRFVYGTTTEGPQGLLIFTEEGELDPASSYGADGTVVLIADKALFGKSTGDLLAGFDIRARAGSATATSRDTAGPGEYELRGHENCGAVDAAPLLATLAGSTQSGNAPLTVDFVISGASSESTLTSWSLDFGDGQFVEEQSFGSASNAEITHVYQEAGVFRARATVKNSEGQVSENLAEHTVTVDPEDTTGGDGGDAGNPGPSAQRGGSLGGGFLMLLMLPLLRRRRS
ncbi:MAG: PKD domain-containing protein [Oceanococcus sp.]